MPTPATLHSADRQHLFLARLADRLCPRCATPTVLEGYMAEAGPGYNAHGEDHRCPACNQRYLVREERRLKPRDALSERDIAQLVKAWHGA